MLKIFCTADNGFLKTSLECGAYRHNMTFQFLRGFRNDIIFGVFLGQTQDELKVQALTVTKKSWIVRRNKAPFL